MKCSRCKVEKEEAAFEVGKTKCRQCCDKLLFYYKENRTSEIERAKRRQRDKKKRPIINAQKRNLNRKNPASYLLCMVKSRAKKYNIPFNLTHEDIVVPEKCPIFGCKLEMGSGFPGPNSPSVDRIVPELGYVRGNIQIISHRANTINNDASLEELRMVVKYLEKVKHDS